MSVLAVEKLAKSYKGRGVVEQVSLQIASGEVVGLLGPNGAGKTTTFNMVVGLVAQDKGSIKIDDLDISFSAMHDRAQKGIGYLPQEASIFRKLSVSHNIMGILELRPELNNKQRQSKLEGLLDEFHIQHIRSSLGLSLSGGERRRVEIARALATDPSFILLDEPFAGVDPISVSDIKEVVNQLKERGIGVLITDHNVRETLDICDRAYIVSQGNIIAEGAPEVVLANSTVRDVYLGDQFKL